MAARRGELGMTQQDLADAAGVDLKTVYNLESGTRWPIAKNRVAISAALKWDGDSLTAIAGGPPEPVRRRSAFPAATPAMQADLDVILPVIESRATAAAEDYPGQKLSGRQVFPDSPAAPAWWPAARAFWDAVTAEAFRQEDIPETVAVMVAWRVQLEQERLREGRATGLMHRPALVALR